MQPPARSRGGTITAEEALGSGKNKNVRMIDLAPIGNGEQQ